MPGDMEALLGSLCYVSQPVNFGMDSVAVLLDDPECIATRTCGPTMPTGVLPNSSDYEEATRAWVVEQVLVPPH